MKNLKTQSNPYTRRDFLGSCGKMTTIAGLSTFLQLKMTNSMLAALPQDSIEGYKALVCVFLYGGNDSFNMLTPAGWSLEYGGYQETRGSLALDKDSLLSIYDKQNSDRRWYGLNPLMPEVHDLYNQDKLAFIANIGTLVTPTTISQYNAKTKVLPRGLFSHSVQQKSWQSSMPDVISHTGWIGRMNDMLNDSGSSDISMNISTGGVNLLQSGVNGGAMNIGLSGVNTLNMYKDAPNVKKAIDSSLLTNYQSVLKNHYNHTRKEVIEEAEQLTEATEGITLNTVFPNTDIGYKLKQAAISIAARDKLGVKRQTFFIDMPGFDTHSSLIYAHGRLYPRLSAALAAFDAAMEELGVHDDVTTYTASDFGRSLTGDGDGTDHGWGGNQIIMGGALNKTKTIYGTYPEDLSLGATTDIGRGRQLPTTSVDQLHGELAEWYGVPNDSNMEQVLPNIRNFWGRNDAPELGILKTS